MDNREFEREGFVFYATAWKSVLSLKDSMPEVADKLLHAIIDYGFYKEYDESDPIVNGVMQSIMFGIDNASNRHEAAVTGGTNSATKSKVDRSQIYALLDAGYTHGKVAAELNISTKTVQRAVKERANSGQSGQDKSMDSLVEFNF